MHERNRVARSECASCSSGCGPAVHRRSFLAAAGGAALASQLGTLDFASSVYAEEKKPEAMPHVGSVITPKPQQLTQVPGIFELGKDMTIRCGGRRTDRQKNTLSLLVKGINRGRGLMLKVIHDAGPAHVIRIGKASTADQPDDRKTRFTIDRPEGYTLEVTPKSITIRGFDKAGLFYGVQTLLQMVRARKGGIPCVQIRDWPDIAFRAFGPFCGGHNIDASRRDGKVYTQLAAYCAANKLNRIAFESSMLPNDEELKAFGEFCRLNFIEPIPGHPFISMKRKNMVRYVEASDEEFKRMMEPVDRALRLLSSEVFCIAGDELVNTYVYQNRRTIYTPEQLKKRPGHQWLLLCLKRFHEYITDRGVRMAMWADSLIDERAFEGAPASMWGYGGKGDEHYKMVDDLPKDIIMWDWQYQPQPAFPTMDYLQKKGFNTIGCSSGLRDWNTAFFAEYARKNRTDKFMGMMCTDWSGPRAIRYSAVPRAGDCFWSVGKYAIEYPAYPPLVGKTRMALPLDNYFETFKKRIATNPLIGIGPGSHNIVIRGEPQINGRLLAAYSIGMIQMKLEQAGGLVTKGGRQATVTYLVEAKPNCHFTRCTLSLATEEGFRGSIAIADGAKGGDYRDIAPIVHEKPTDLDEHVAGANTFRIRIKGVNTGGRAKVILTGVRLDCTVEQDE